MAEEKRRVCVAGGGGFVASWLVKLFYLDDILFMLPSEIHYVSVETEGHDELEKKSQYNYIDVRDLAEALILVNEKPEAKGRYICCSDQAKTQEMVEILRRVYPKYKYPRKYIEVEAKPMKTSEKLQKLGWCDRGLEETLVDSLESYKLQGLVK